MTSPKDSPTASPSEPKQYHEPFQPIDDCLCGRKMGDIHCSHCGSGNVRACVKRAQETTLPTGEVIMNKVWNCRKCGDYFTTLSRMMCNAPPPVAKSVGRPPKNLGATAGGQMPKFDSLDDAPAELAAIVRKLRQDRGYDE